MVELVKGVHDCRVETSLPPCSATGRDPPQETTQASLSPALVDSSLFEAVAQEAVGCKRMRQLGFVPILEIGLAQIVVDPPISRDQRFGHPARFAHWIEAELMLRGSCSPKRQRDGPQ